MIPEITLVLIALAVMVILMAIGLEIAWSIGIAATVTFVLFVGQPFNQLIWSSWDAANSFTLTAVPLFVFMGTILANTGVAEALFAGIEKWLDRLPGSLACTTLTAAGIFAAMSGSGMAATSVFGKVAFPPMETRGYSPRLSLGSIAIGATLAPLIPPSILLIIYGTWQGVSVVSLFAAALVPGVILCFLYIMTAIIMVKLNPNLAPPPPRYSWREKLLALRGIFPFLLVVFGVLGSIFGGVMTPTEAASLGAFLSMALALVYKRLSWAILKTSLYDAVRVTSFGIFIYAMAVGLAHALNMMGITGQITEFVLGLPIGKYGTIALFIVMYLILGCFMGSWEMLFLTFPFVMPIISAYNIDLVWWGVLYVMLGDIGNVTPPFGMTLFVLHGIVPKYSMETVALAALPFIITTLLLVAAMVMFPQLALWFPSLLLSG
ncbi:MAG: TRAP transporter large permease subunit [Chloroflexi bacterium]|nr:TRAP transporter large permease subunit [Chloroflexota bacterium]